VPDLLEHQEFNRIADGLKMKKYSKLHDTACPTHPSLRCVSKKNIPDIFDCNLKNNYQILIIFGKNIPDTTYHQMTIQLFTSPSVCFCTTWGKHNQRNITFYPMRYDCLINIIRKNTFCLHFCYFG